MFTQPQEFQIPRQPLPIDGTEYGCDLGSIQSILPDNIKNEPSRNKPQFNESQGSQYYEELESMSVNSGSLNIPNNGTQPYNTSINENKGSQNTFFSPNHSIQFQQSLLSRLHNKVTYQDVANQAQQLLDKLSTSTPLTNYNHLRQIRNSINMSSSQYLPKMNMLTNSLASQSSPPQRLEPILNNFKEWQESPSNASLRGNQLRTNDNLHSSTPRNSENLRLLSNQNIVSRQILMNDTIQRQNNPIPQSTFVPKMPNLDINSNMRRLDTASELIYPNRRVEYLPHSF